MYHVYGIYMNVTHISEVVKHISVMYLHILGVYYRATQLGMATVASSLSPSDALWVFSELSKARKNFALENELHLLYQVLSSVVCVL